MLYGIEGFSETKIQDNKFTQVFQIDAIIQLIDKTIN